MEVVANFSINTISGLSVSFTDRSVGVISSWSWDFGDSQTSTNQHPTHVYAAQGNYFVTLTVVAGAPDTGTSSLRQQIVLYANGGIGYSIEQMIANQMPSGVSYNVNAIDTGIKEWQLYLQAAAGILDADVYDQTKWPILYNMLIAKLVIWNLIIDSATQYMLATGTVATTGSGALKSIETGPSKAEWYDASTLMESITKGTGANGTGLITVLQSEICMLARRLGVNLGICPAIKRLTVFEIAKLSECRPQRI